MTTIGEERVRTEFNPSQDTLVDEIKQTTARLINLCEGLRMRDARLVALAQTAYEEAAMWAVKAATDKIVPEAKTAYEGYADTNSYRLRSADGL